MDSVFPQVIESPKHYVDWFTNRVEIDRVNRLLQKLRRNAELADNVPIQMRESVDPNIIPSALREIEMVHSNLRELDENTVVKVWLTAHILAWYDPHEGQRRKLYNIKQVLEVEVVEEYKAAYSRFKLRWEPYYVAKYGEVKAPLPEGAKGPQSTLARDRLILERGKQAQILYDLIREQAWDVENVIMGVLQAARSYDEGGGMKPFDKRAREILEERKQRETLTIERSTAS